MDSRTRDMGPEPRGYYLSPEREREILALDYACSHAEAEYTGLFTPLGILRAFSEGNFSEEERKHALQAADVATRQHFGHDFELFFHKDMWEAARDNPSDERIRACIDALAASIRVWGEFCVKHADKAELEREAETRRNEGDFMNPLYEYVSGHEARHVADTLRNATTTWDAADIFYAIGSMQHLMALVERLRTRIDEGDLQVTENDYDASQAIEIISRTRDSFVRALRARNWEVAETGIPAVDFSSIDKDAFAQTQAIAEVLREEEIRVA